MSTQSWALLAVAAVLLFWTVGAYNRLVGLRSELLRAITAVDAQFHARQAVLAQWAEGLAGRADAQALAAFMPREDPRDCLIGPSATLAGLPQGAGQGGLDD